LIKKELQYKEVSVATFDFNGVMAIYIKPNQPLSSIGPGFCCLLWRDRPWDHADGCSTSVVRMY